MDLRLSTVTIPNIIKRVVYRCLYIIEHPLIYYRYNILKKIIERSSRLYSDKRYLEIMFPLCTGYKLNLDYPQTFNEKLQWLKLYYHKTEFTFMVDKVESKKNAAKIIGEDHVIPTINVYNNVEEIDFDKLPEKFVLKCTHDSGDLAICKDKLLLNQQEVLKKLKKGLKHNYFYYGREWPYKNVVPRIIAEKYLTDDGKEIKDYKIFNFGGEPKIIEVDYNRFIDHKRQLYTLDWKRIDATYVYPNNDSIIEKPKQLDQMLDFARKLSKGHPFIRTDFYVVNETVYFGELTFYPECGFGLITPFEFDLEMGHWIKLPKPTASA